MKFKLIKKDCVDVRCYGQAGFSTGDIVDFDGHLADKAQANPNYEKVIAKTVKKAVVKK